MPPYASATTPNTISRIARSFTCHLPSPEDAAQHPLLQPREEALDGALDALLHRALVDRAEPRRNRVPLLEVLRVDRASFDRLQIRDATERLVPERFRRVGRLRAPPGGP